MGALALFAREAGYEVYGSDLNPGPVVRELETAGIKFKIGPDAQDGKWLQHCIDEGVEWFVYTSALPADHTELVLAGEKLKCTKRDGLISQIVQDKGLKMVAVAGTHGKTTTTAMIIWACHELKLPISYLVGSNLPFGPAGKFNPEARYFVYEADEYGNAYLLTVDRPKHTTDLPYHIFKVELEDLEYGERGEGLYYMEKDSYVK